MTGKTDTEVLIGGRVLTISGAESEEYVQKVASYINNKISDYMKNEGFKRQPAEMQGVLLEINIADDYFKEKHRVEELEEALSAKEKELYNIKHELIASQIKLENTEKSAKDYKNRLEEAEKKLQRAGIKA